jgi:hypothetical protein
MNRRRPTTRLVQGVAATVLGGEIVVEPVPEGVSTYVYRLRRGAEVFYLRVLPEEGSTFTPEAEAHSILRRQGVHVPLVVYWEDHHPVLGRSVMITAEIKGVAVGGSHVGAELPQILRSAGRDIALLKRVPVEGFGWVRRDAPEGLGLCAEVSTEREFLLADLDRSLSALYGSALSCPLPSMRHPWCVVDGAWFTCSG